MVNMKRDIHELPVSEWGDISETAPGSIVNVTVLCAHVFGLGVAIEGTAGFGHVNSPRVTDGRYTMEIGFELVGKTVPARLLAVNSGRQPTLSLRHSDLADESNRGP